MSSPPAPWPPASPDLLLSIVGVTIGAVALWIAVPAFLRSRAFRRYMGEEDTHNVQNLKTLLVGCRDVISEMLRDPGDDARYYRSLLALSSTLSGALFHNVEYVGRPFRASVQALRLVLLRASTSGRPESFRALQTAADHVGTLIENPSPPPPESRPGA